MQPAGIARSEGRSERASSPGRPFYRKAQFIIDHVRSRPRLGRYRRSVDFVFSSSGMERQVGGDPRRAALPIRHASMLTAGSLAFSSSDIRPCIRKIDLEYEVLVI